MSMVTGDRYLSSLVKFVERNADSLIEGTLVLKLNPVGLRYVHSRFEALAELESLIAGAPVDYLRAYISDLGDHRAIEQLRRILRLLPSIKVVARLPYPMKDPMPLSLKVFERLKVLELRGCDLSTSAAQGLLELRNCLEKLICHNSTDALRHVFASRIVEIKDSPQWNRLSFVSCACNNLVLMDESLQLLPAVETLDLSRNKFAKVDNLRVCTKLKHLDLGFSQLRSIASFSEVSCHIVKLVLRNNALTTLSGIEHLKSLEGLDLSYNIISSFLEMELLVGISSLQSLWLEGNPLCTARWYRAHVFSFFPYPDKLKLDDRKISTQELWERQIINARRQKRPASFGFYSPAKGDAELALNASSKRKTISRLVSIKNEEQSTSISSDRFSDSGDESQNKEENVSPTEEAGVVNLIERIEYSKKERSALWLQELKEWINSGGYLDGAECCETVVHGHKWNVGSKVNNEHTGETQNDCESIQASADPSSMNVQEPDGSISQRYAHRVVGEASNSYLGYNAGDYLLSIKQMSHNQEIDLSTTSKVCSSASLGGSQLDTILVPIGERLTGHNTPSLSHIDDVIESQSSSLYPGSPPHYQEDILHRRQFLEEEFLQLSVDSLSIVSSDSDTSCSDHDSSECAQCIAEVDQYLINKYSEYNHDDNVSAIAVEDGCNENVPSLTQNEVVPSLSSAEGNCSDVNARQSETSCCLSNNGISEKFHDTGTVISMKHDDVWSDKKVHNKKPKRRIVSLTVECSSNVVEPLSTPNGNEDLFVDACDSEEPSISHDGDSYDKEHKDHLIAHNGE